MFWQGLSYKRKCPITVLITSAPFIEFYMRTRHKL